MTDSGKIIAGLRHQATRHGQGGVPKLFNDAADYIATLEAEKIALADIGAELYETLQTERQKVEDAEWLADEFYTVSCLNLSDATEPECLAYQVYDRQGQLIGDSNVPTYWGALRAAREVSDDD